MVGKGERTVCGEGDREKGATGGGDRPPSPRAVVTAVSIKRGHAQPQPQPRSQAKPN
jgi:hypothetical protein